MFTPAPSKQRPSAFITVTIAHQLRLNLVLQCRRSVCYYRAASLKNLNVKSPDLQVSTLRLTMIPLVESRSTI